MTLVEDITRVREDVAYIKAKIDALPDHEKRLRSLERWRYGIPGGLLVTLISLFLS